MDISVSRLNNRMALQVPGELPLGLVFIVGRVESLGAPAGGTVRFELVDAGYRLRCRLPAAVAEETLLKEKDRVRASGHLAFDSHSAQYQLLARDIEVLAAQAPDREKAQQAAAQGAAAQGATPGTAGVQPQSSVDSVIPTDLPPWVQKLAPPEVKEELGLVQEGEGTEPPSEMEAAGASEEEGLKAADTPTELPPEMLAFLSSAIDSDEEIELTPEMIAEYLPEVARRKDAAPDRRAREEDIQEEPASIIVEEGTSAAAGEVAGAGEWAEDDISLPPDHTTRTSGREGPESSGPDVISPPRKAPQSEERSQPRPIRQYVEYAVIVLLTLLIIAALFIVVLLLQA